MHPLNPYLTKRPDFAQLAETYPDFAPFVKKAEDGYVSIDFQDPSALRALTRCLLLEDWGLDVDLREDRICPTIPNRLDYILHVLDLESYFPSTSTGRPIRVLDIGTGAVAIYPILLHQLRPHAQIVATELDEISYNHALSVLEKNSISSASITVLKSPASEPILFPILQTKTDDEWWDLTICNPPFFGSEEEMRQGQELKARFSHAAPTAATNELITPGGEIEFVSKMIEESITIGQRCGWFTSLIGKYSSLGPLVDLLHRHKIDNYMLKVIKQAKTNRWILGWSHRPIRLPDHLARPELVAPNTSFTRLPPPSNIFLHRPQPDMPLSAMRTAVLDVLESISLSPSSSSGSAKYVEGEEDALVISPSENTWSRAARRQAARQVMEVDNQPIGDAETPGASSSRIPDSQTTPLFQAKIRFSPVPKPQSQVQVRDEDVGSNGQLEMDWLEGRDRLLVEGLWKSILRQAELLGKRATETNAEEEGMNGEGSERTSGKGRGRGRGTGDRGRGRGRTGGNWGFERPRQRMRLDGTYPSSRDARW